jgi:deoxyribodipyrimidine photo-lyase
MLKRSIFIFRRDLRLQDNLGLIEAMEASHGVIPVFIIDPQLLARWRGAEKRLTFLTMALRKLDETLRARGSRLVVLEGRPIDVVSDLIDSHAVDGVFINRDYTPVARRRDAKLRTLCESKNVQFFTYTDLLLNEPEYVAKADGSPYTIFTPYYKKAQQLRILDPVEFSESNLEYFDHDNVLSPISLAGSLEDESGINSVDVVDKLERISGLADYDSSRDLPSIEGTARLSALLRFGLVSVRQVYQSVNKAHSTSHGLIRQLYWRDFYFQIGYHFPHVYHSSFREKYRNIPWSNDESAFKKWQEGKTGFPIVDAGMRELLETGYMHNRVRMITASFLTKNLHIDWRKGEAHFGKHLLDHDPALNNGNWQWSASTGCDAQPYFRVFNPWRQQKRFDNECRYIKRWIPELENRSAKEIHALETHDDYYLPKITNLKISAEESKAMFKAAGS